MWVKQYCAKNLEPPTFLNILFPRNKIIVQTSWAMVLQAFLFLSFTPFQSVPEAAEQ